MTTCVHNLFGGQRWVDQYGELKITNESLICKLTFVKVRFCSKIFDTFVRKYNFFHIIILQASYWSAKRHEVHGNISTLDGKVVRKLFGRWSEALFSGHPPAAKCIWRPGILNN